MNAKNKAKMFSSSTSNKNYDKNLLTINDENDIPQNNNPAFKDSGIYCLFIYNFFKNVLGTTQKKLIFLIVCITILAALLLITGFINPEFVIPDCSKVCKKPYKIKVYSDRTLESQLKKCKYKKGIFYLILLYLL